MGGGVGGRGIMDGGGEVETIGLRSAREYIIQDGEYSQYFVITKWKVTFKNCV